MPEPNPAFCLVSGHRMYRLAGGEWVVGRSAIDGLLILDRQASRKHALLRVSADAVEVEDLGSRNGTYVNGARIGSRVALRPGDRLQIGETILVMEVDSPDTDDDDWTDHASREVVFVGGEALEGGFVETETTLSVRHGGHRVDTGQIALHTLLLVLGDEEWTERIREGADILPALVVIEASGEQAVDSASRVSRGILILDLDAAEGRGEKVIESWRSNPVRGPIVLSSPQDDEDGMAVARSLGADSHVRRRAAASRVIAEVRHWLRAAADANLL